MMVYWGDERMKTRATIDDLYKIEGKAELVHGKVVEMPPSGDDPGFASLKIASRLLQNFSVQLNQCLTPLHKEQVSCRTGTHWCF
jgi:hypothetical protein